MSTVARIDSRYYLRGWAGKLTECKSDENDVKQESDDNCSSDETN